MQPMGIGALFVVGTAGFVVTPRLGFWLAGASAPRRASWLPWLSAALFALAWQLPNPSLADTTTFTQHVVGGGAASALVGLFMALNLGIRSSALRVVFAYALAASLGVAFELVELVYDQLQGTNHTTDSAWDLLANSTGAVLVAVLLEGLLRVGRRTDSSPLWI